MLEFFLGGTFVNHAALVDHVAQAVTHPGVGAQAVTSGAAGLLVVALDVFGHVQMRHKTHVRFVDAHAKGNGGHHDHAFFPQETVLMGLAHRAVQTRVVGQRVNPRLTQGVGHVLDFFARLAVNNAGLVRVLTLYKTQQLGGGIALFHNGVADIGPVKAAHKGARLLQLEPLQDVGARQVVGRGRQRHAGHAGEALMQHGQRAVFRTEVVAPLAHAMGFIDRKQAELAALKQRVELRQKTRRSDALGRGIEQRDVPAQHALLDLVGLFARERGVQKSCADAGLMQGTHLVVHERNEGRNDERHPLPRAVAGNRGDLVAQRLTAARGHEHQSVAATAHMFNDVLLGATKALVAEYFMQDVGIRHEAGVPGWPTTQPTLKSRVC